MVSLSTPTTNWTDKNSSEAVLQFELLEDAYNYEVVRAIDKRWSVSRVEGPDDEKEYLAFLKREEFSYIT